jgi:hypothetical protein
MKRFGLFFAAALTLLTINSTGIAQSISDLPQSLSTEKTDEQKYNDRVRDNIQRPRTPKILKEGSLAPPQADRDLWKSFLSNSNTGLIRLLPREAYDWGVYEVPKTVDIRGGGTYYSFFYQGHEQGYGSDIMLERDKLYSGLAGADIGILTNLGEISLSELTVDDPQVVFLANYSAPRNEPGARVEQKRASAGFALSGQDYTRTIQLTVGSTYLVRSIVYDRSDTLTAFTVTRKDHDGSVIIIWKRLKNFRTPILN